MQYFSDTDIEFQTGEQGKTKNMTLEEDQDNYKLILVSVIKDISSVTNY